MNVGGTMKTEVWEARHILEVGWTGHGGGLDVESEREGGDRNGSQGSMDSWLGRDGLYQEGGLPRGNKFERKERP